MKMEHLNNNLGDVYLVQHSYEIDDREETKFIGIFSTQSKAQSAIDELALQPGFNQMPANCFSLNKISIDHYEWKEGFIKWDEA